MKSTQEKTVKIAVPTGDLHGTLLVPRATSDARPALVILIAGSGPTTRDGNSVAGGQIILRNDSLKQLAEALAAQGVATLRYDKRGVGASAAAMPVGHLPVVENFVDDAAAWVDAYANDDRFSKIYLAGHSEGALLATLAAQKVQGASGLVLIAGMGRKAADVLREQVMRQLISAQDKEMFRHITQELEQGREVPPPAQNHPLYNLFMPSLQPYWISMFRYDPAAELARTGLPALILQGDCDIQVSTQDAARLSAAHRQAEMKVIAGMNHVFRKAAADDMAAQYKTYNDHTTPINPALAQVISAFVASHGDKAAYPARQP